MHDVVLGRAAYERRAWADAYAALSPAFASGALEAGDIERLAVCATLTGREDVSIQAFERLHQSWLDASQPLRAARAAFWAAMRLFSLGERARASAWLARAERLLEGEAPDSVERGYLKLPLVFRQTAARDYAGAQASAAEAAAIGLRQQEPDLRALGRSFEGRALIRQGKLAEGLPLLDEAMLSVTAGELSPTVAGLIYCGVIAACQQSYALERAREWTAALSGWCEGQPQLVAFAGACLIHRSEIMQLGGAWPEAVEAARQAALRLSDTRDAEAGNAFYQQGELHRLRGDRALAEKAYTLASERGREPQPGLALLRLAEGRSDLSLAALRRVLSATTEALARARFLPAYVEVLLAAAELGEARRAADELEATAQASGMESLTALAQHAQATRLLAEGDAHGATEPLRRAFELWQRAGAPYQSARVRLALALAFKALGDADGSQLEARAANKIFAGLGAAPDLAATSQLLAPAPSATRPTPSEHGLTERELEVLRLVAAGKTNKEIATALFLSERTVDRHVSNLFAKLGVSTRSAATAWAYQQQLLG